MENENDSTVGGGGRRTMGGGTRIQVAKVELIERYSLTEIMVGFSTCFHLGCDPILQESCSKNYNKHNFIIRSPPVSPPSRTNTTPFSGVLLFSIYWCWA